MKVVVVWFMRENESETQMKGRERRKSWRGREVVRKINKK